ncbi:ATP-dependent Clp protease proteolytic subunit [Lacrimispora sp. 38-1]|uniref:ATP-dependent Clp protease proteolytic subunit n=1 Tax=Lacrimispora sp. 38-1 TaxID=3125778 RepID=UPI003CE75964
MKMIPSVIKTTSNGDRENDIYSTLLEDRIIFLNNEITDDVASTVIAQLLFLESKDSKKDINLYINSTGGSMTAGMAIFDTMNFIKCDVLTICIGIAARMGAFLLAAGAQHKRYALANSEVMIHQIAGITKGQATDIDIEATRIARIKQKINEILAGNTGKTINEINQDTDREFYMTADEAKRYGIIDEIIFNR